MPVYGQYMAFIISNYQIVYVNIYSNKDLSIMAKYNIGIETGTWKQALLELTYASI